MSIKSVLEPKIQEKNALVIEHNFGSRTTLLNPVNPNGIISESTVLFYTLKGCDVFFIFEFYCTVTFFSILIPAEKILSVYKNFGFRTAFWNDLTSSNEVLIYM